MAVRLPAAAAALVCVVGLAACTGDTGRAAGLRVVASTTQVADLVREVGGPRVDMHQILRPNSDPHDYEPRPSDAEQIARAKLVFQSGGELDQWLGGVISGAGGRARVVRLIDSVRTIGRDPHWWEDPRDTERLVRQVRREGVKAIFPESALNPKLERAVSRETGARVGGTLWADSLGPRGSSGATYLTAMASNTETMVDGMTGGAIACRPRP